MTDEPIRPSEDPFLVFISSRQDEELSRARDLSIDTVGKYPGMKVWAFEDALPVPKLPGTDTSETRVGLTS